jgi:mono/diheme cytochrome c family protein
LAGSHIRLKSLVAAAALICILGGAVFFLLTSPRPLAAVDLPQHTPDPERGKILYIIGGCISCHKPPSDAADKDAGLPSGGRPFKTPIGTFYPPNITPDPSTGIGNWSTLDFINAVHGGISPRGAHYFPAFPYTSYHRMSLADVLDLESYAATLPGVTAANRSHDVYLAPLLRRGVGLWKSLAMRDEPVAPDPSQTESWNLGYYLVNGPGHCGECHTPRNLLMISDSDRHLAGGPHPEGKGKVPSLRGLVERGRYADAEELTSAMRFGEMMGFDRLSRGGMGDVQANLAKLPEGHVRAIAEYLVSLK